MRQHSLEANRTPKHETVCRSAISPLVMAYQTAADRGAYPAGPRFLTAAEARMLRPKRQPTPTPGVFSSHSQTATCLLCLRTAEEKQQALRCLPHRAPHPTTPAKSSHRPKSPISRHFALGVRASTFERRRRHDAVHSDED